MNHFSGVLMVFVFLGVLAVLLRSVCLGFRFLPGSAAGLLAARVRPGPWVPLCLFLLCVGSRGAVSVLLGSLAAFMFSLLLLCFIWLAP